MAQYPDSLFSKANKRAPSSQHTFGLLITSILIILSMLLLAVTFPKLSLIPVFVGLVVYGISIFKGKYIATKGIIFTYWDAQILGIVFTVIGVFAIIFTLLS